MCSPLSSCLAFSFLWLLWWFLIFWTRSDNLHSFAFRLLLSYSGAQLFLPCLHPQISNFLNLVFYSPDWNTGTLFLFPSSQQSTTQESSCNPPCMHLKRQIALDPTALKISGWQNFKKSKCVIFTFYRFQLEWYWQNLSYRGNSSVICTHSPIWVKQHIFCIRISNRCLGLLEFI